MPTCSRVVFPALWLITVPETVPDVRAPNYKCFAGLFFSIISTDGIVARVLWSIPKKTLTKFTFKKPESAKENHVSSVTGASGAAPITTAQPGGSMSTFSLVDKVILVSGAGRGLGLTQAEALLEAGATVYALDRLPELCEDFFCVQKRATAELGTSFHYQNINVRETDGLIAIAGIQQKTLELDFSVKDVNRIFEINITGVFMTA
ncbi:hypothetical protein B7463_g9974, partial [Scytalidium lignicola]